ncbi:MAG: hypothetical protein Q7R57_09350 [Dehalococcoidales bacterium]|nr:hypothetical protein [Dehalococcoidales bacterium]
MTSGSKEPSAPAARKKRKWLGRIGTFLMMGGWLLVVVLVLGIIVLVSVLTK